jgi:hypothetical protein
MHNRQSQANIYKLITITIATEKLHLEKNKHKTCTDSAGHTGYGAFSIVFIS